MSTLAHVFEAAGIATVVFASMADVARKVGPPRVLACDFPLGRPLGKPNDADFQQSVLRAGLFLLESGVPEFVHFGEIVQSDEVPMACALPPRDDPDAPAAVDEARGFRAAYRRAVEARGVSAVGRAIDADSVPEALAVLDAWASGTPWTEMALPGKNTVAVCHDIRSFYLEAALELVGDAAPGGRSFDAWFHEVTAAGRTVLAARRALRDQGAPFPFWFYMAPGHLE